MTSTLRRPTDRPAGAAGRGRHRDGDARRRTGRRGRHTVAVDLLAPAFVATYLLFTFEPFDLVLPIPWKVTSLVMPTLGVLVLLLTPTRRLTRVPVVWSMVALLGFFWLSWTWSELPSISLDLLFREVLPLLVLAAVVGTMHPRAVVRTLLGVVVVVCAWSLLASIALPMSRVAVQEDGTETLQHGFRGTFGHKNMLGMFAVYGLCVVLPFWRSRGGKAVALLCIALVLLSRSATAGSGLMAVMFCWFWIAAIDVQKEPRERQFLGVVSILSAVAAILLALGLMPTLLGLYQKDLTFSGRTIIWAESLETLRHEPILGYGVGGIWRNELSPITVDLRRRIGFEAAHAHNGAIELLLEVGIVGFGIFLAYFVRTLRLAFHAFGRRAMSAYGQWGILTMLALLLMSISEPLFRVPSLGLMTMVAVVLTVLRNDETRPVKAKRRATTL